jgi:hypothetical protein
MELLVTEMHKPVNEMKIEAAVALASLSITITPLFAQLPEALKRKFDEAERRIVRLQRSAFPALPGNVVRELQRRGCTIPQEAYTKKPHNVIRGEFLKSGQTDWAVLCSVGWSSSILVFWNGSEKNVSEIAKREDHIFLQGISADKIGFSRGIRPVGKDFIMRHYRAYGGPTPPPIDHQGIDDAFIEKASVTHYCDGGKWLRLTGAD